MLHRVRLAMQDDFSGGMLGGEVEVDKTFIGGKSRNMHKGRKIEVQKKGRNDGNRLSCLASSNALAQTSRSVSELASSTTASVRASLLKLRRTQPLDLKSIRMNGVDAGALETAASTRW